MFILMDFKQFTHKIILKGVSVTFNSKLQVPCFIEKTRGFCVLFPFVFVILSYY